MPCHLSEPLEDKADRATAPKPNPVWEKKVRRLMSVTASIRLRLGKNGFNHLTMHIS